MRRSIWCTGVVLIGSAAWLYLAATYVCNYPNSYLSLCAEVAYRMGGECNPVYQLSQVVVTRVRDGVDEMLHDQGYIHVGRNQPCCSCEPCTPCTPSTEAIAASVPYSMIEVMPDMRVEVSPDVVGGGSEECTSGVITVGAFAPPSDEDADPAPKTMPTLPADEKADEAPATMPYIEDEDYDSSLIEFWKSLGKEKVKEAEPKEEPKTMKPEEESEPAPEASESPESGNQMNQMNQMPASHYSSHPSCTGCPGTVTCPYTGRTYPADPNDDPKDPVVPTTTHKKKKKKKDDAGNTPSKMSKLIQMEKSTEDVPVHPEVDTMEYRYDDAKIGEFDPQPE